MLIYALCLSCALFPFALTRFLFLFSLLFPREARLSGKHGGREGERYLDRSFIDGFHSTFNQSINQYIATQSTSTHPPKHHIYFNLPTPSHPLPSAPATLLAKLSISSPENNFHRAPSSPLLNRLPPVVFSLAFLACSLAFDCSPASSASIGLRSASREGLGMDLAGFCCSACLRAARRVRRMSVVR